MGRLDRTEISLVVFLAWVAIYLPGLGVPELTVEEPRRVLPAVTMLKTGNWLVPHLGGEAYYGKPPLINWLVAGSFLLTGQQNELSARLPSALFVLAFVALLLWFPGDWPRLEARLITAVLFLTSYAVIKKGRQIEIEAVYVTLASMALFTWMALWAGDRRRWALWLVPCPFLACGMLTKGPAILLFYYAAVVGVLAYSRRLRALLSAPHLLAVVLCLAIPALWAYLASRQVPADRAATNLSSEIVWRLTSTDIDWSKWAVQVARAFANPLPWLLFLPLLWRRDFTGHIPAVHLPLFRGARLGLVVSFVAITLIPGNNGRYSMPDVGLECLLLGWVLGETSELPDQGRLWRTIALAGFVLAIPLAAAGLVVVRTDLWAVVFLSATMGLAVVLLRRRAVFRTPVQLACLSLLLAAVLMLEYTLFVLPLQQKSEKRRPVAAALNALVPASEPLYLYQPGHLDFLFYVGNPIEYLLQPSQIDGRVRFLLLPESAYQQFKAEPALAPRLGPTLHRLPYRRGVDFRLIELLTPPPGRGTSGG